MFPKGSEGSNPSPGTKMDRTPYIISFLHDHLAVELSPFYDHRELDTVDRAIIKNNNEMPHPSGLITIPAGAFLLPISWFLQENRTLTTKISYFNSLFWQELPKRPDIFVSWVVTTCVIHNGKFYGMQITPSDIWNVFPEPVIGEIGCK